MHRVLLDCLVSGVVCARVLCNGERGARCAPLLGCVRVAIVSPRTGLCAVSIKQRAPHRVLASFSFILIARDSAGFARLSPLPLVSASPLLLLLELSALLVSALCSALRLCVLLCSSFCLISVTHRVRIQHLAQSTGSGWRKQ